MGTRLAAIAAVTAVCTGCGGDEPTVEPEPDFVVGFADSQFAGPDGALWAQRAAEAGAGSIRVNLYWSVAAVSEPADPRDHEDPAYDWSAIDAAVAVAADQDLDVLLTVLSAPPWAEGPGRPDAELAPAGTWRPDPEAFGDFAHAVASRYADEVDVYAAWNEPNISTYLTPQYADGENASAAIYVELLNSFHDEVKAVAPEALVSTAGTAPAGDEDGLRTSPLEFWRRVLCLDQAGQAIDCPAGEEARFDLLAHHPIVFPPEPPAFTYPDPDDVSVANFGELVELLRRAEQLETTGTAGAHGLIADELWWESDPPQPGGVPATEHAAYIADALVSLREQGAGGAWFLQLRDDPIGPDEDGANPFTALRSYQTGIFTAEGEPKPAFDAIRGFTATP